MDQIRTILNAYRRSPKIKPLARRFGISRTTIKKYLRHCKDTGKSLDEIVLLQDAELKSILYPEKQTQYDDRQTNFITQVDYWIVELRRAGVTRKLLWEEYKLNDPDGLAYSQFCERLSRHIESKKLTMSLKHNPAHQLMLDFAGKKMKWIDRKTGEEHLVEVLVGVLPFSQYTFVIALPSQKINDFISGINQALLFYGGVPKSILSDNLRSYVKKADRYDPDFTELCRQLGEHYQLDLSATRAGKPKDKASVENMVSTIYKRIYAPLRNVEFYSLDSLNRAILEKLKEHNSKIFQKKAGSRESIFQEYEKQHLYQLPSDIFEIKKQTKAKVQKNYHVFLGEEKNYYSVHYSHVGRKVNVLYTTKTIEIFYKEIRIAVHERLRTSGNHKYCTTPGHMPDKHQIYERLQGHTGEDFTSLAKNIGPNTEWAISKILISRIHEEQSYKSCLGVLRLANKYGKERLEQACLRCLEVDHVSYGRLKNILQKNLDQPQIDLFTTQSPEHDNIRGPEAYQ